MWVQKPEGPKYEHAVMWGKMPIVSLQWFQDSLLAGGTVVRLCLYWVYVVCCCLFCPGEGGKLSFIGLNGRSDFCMRSVSEACLTRLFRSVCMYMCVVAVVAAGALAEQKYLVHPMGGSMSFMQAGTPVNFSPFIAETESMYVRGGAVSGRVGCMVCGWLLSLSPCGRWGVGWTALCVSS